jgi:hypothetical protein
VTGYEHAEDAGVYKLSDDLALVQTVDFFTPTVDDPFTFGRIAAVNALNDIYAMGGRPLTAMNIVCFPIKTMDKAVLRDVLRGGLDKMREAGVLLVGGHSVEDTEIKYGLSVTGTIHPDRVLFNRGARPGDKLILTKPLGTGIAATALKAGVAAPALVEQATACMTTLNKQAAELMISAETSIPARISRASVSWGMPAKPLKAATSACASRRPEYPFWSVFGNWWKPVICPAGCTATGTTAWARWKRRPPVRTGSLTSASIRRRRAACFSVFRRTTRNRS